MSSAMPEDQDCNMGDTDVEAPDLPTEIIVHILSFLHTPDRKDASLVCRRWYHASQESQFQNSTTFRFPASAWSVDLLRGLGQRSRCSLAISQMDGFSSSRNLLLEVGLCLGSRLEGLALPGSSLTEASLLGLLPRLTALRRLDLRGLDSLFMSGAFLSREEHRRQVGQALSGLEELDLSDLRYLSDLTFNRLTGCTPRLRRLSLAGCHIAFEFDPYAGVPLAPDRDSSALLSLRNLRRLLAKQSGTLTGLDLSRTAITPESLRTVAQVPGLALEELVLQGCKELTDPSVEVLVRHQGGLRRLDLSGCTGLSSRAAQAAALGLGELRELSLARAWRLTEKGLSDLVALPSLRRLDLSECVHVSGVELVRGLSVPGRPPAQLETLSLRSCSYLGDAAVCSLARLLGPSLRELDLSSCVWLTDVSVRPIATCLRRLVVLRLAWCKELTDWGLLGLTGPSKEMLPAPQMDDKGPTFTRTFGNMGFFQPPSLPCEERLPVVTEQELEQFRQQQGASLLALSRLQELDLSGCYKLTDTSLSQVVRHPDLRSLSLSVLPRLSDAGLASVVRHCPGLTRLALSRCPGLSDHGLEHAAPHLHRLQHLLLAGCDNITDRSLHVVMQHCQRLRTLDVSMCNHISIETVDLVQSQLPFLESVQCRHVGGSDLSLTSLTL